MPVQICDSLHSKISPIFCHKNRIKLELCFYCQFFFYWSGYISKSLGLRVYYFRWIQLDLDVLKMSHQPWNQVWSVSLRLQGITAEGKHAQRCLEFSSSWLQSHPAKGQFQICILFTTNSMKHWAISTRPRHAHSASTHGTRVCTFHLGTLLPSDILWLSFPPWWTGSEHSRAQTTAQIVYSSHSAVCMWTIRSVVYITRTQSLTHTHIHTYTQTEGCNWDTLHTPVEAVWMEQLLVRRQHCLSHISLAWRDARKVLTVSWLWLEWPRVTRTYLWLPRVLCGCTTKTEAYLAAEDWQQQ